MSIPGDTKQAFCSICGTETTWEYIVVQLGDGVFGLESASSPESHQIHRWRCRNHTTPDGRIKEEFKKGHRLHTVDK